MTEREKQLRATVAQYRLASESLMVVAKVRGLPKELRESLLQRWDVPALAAVKAGNGDANERELAHYALMGAMDRDRRDHTRSLQALAWGFQEAAAQLESLLGESKPAKKKKAPQKR